LLAIPNKPCAVLLACLLGGFAVFFAVLWIGKPHPATCPVAIRPATWAKVGIGTRESEMAALLGIPAGDYRTNKEIRYLFVIMGFPPPGPDEAIVKEWLTDNYAIRIWFDSHGKAVYIQSARGLPPPNWLELLMIDLRRYLP
jgi:hypothetical protein